ncbi:MAG: hypothetical protein K0R03_920 [Moraxellaceae bacterium]|nr:hypothetical protein [Moraxellaceae bacterium]
MQRLCKVIASFANPGDLTVNYGGGRGKKPVRNMDIWGGSP